MKWPKLLLDILKVAGWLFVFLAITDWFSKHRDFSLLALTQDALVAVAFALGIVGVRELDRAGYRRARRIWWTCIISFCAIVGILLIVSIFYNIKMLLLGVYYGEDLFWVLSIAPFPIALYLNRNQSKIDSQPTTADAP